MSQVISKVGLVVARSRSLDASRFRAAAFWLAVVVATWLIASLLLAVTGRELLANGLFSRDMLRWLAAGVLVAGLLAPYGNRLVAEDILWLWLWTYDIFCALPIMAGSRYQAPVTIAAASGLTVSAAIVLAVRLRKPRQVAGQRRILMLPAVLSLVWVAVLRSADNLVVDRLAFAVWVNLLVVVAREIWLRAASRAGTDVT